MTPEETKHIIFLLEQSAKLLRTIAISTVILAILSVLAFLF